ncbi:MULTISPECIES: beta-propeller fold lactonase family protein [unclassified Pseudomonas]|uniref:lactonase family protein n=1 Tax=unclassified Pseudomonas TaxID=196821 RepID=UPI0007029BC9|nr:MULTISPECIES: beta-propeller fold lactonase family protein [unclassified Pseudomonas]KQZ83777.1 hypothetical protein ASD60_07110 [Pseudomonas sp. Root562]
MKKTFRALFLAAVIPAIAFAEISPTSQQDDAKLLYASLGEKLLGYSIDPDNASLTFLSETVAPANVQFAVKNNAGNILYVVSSNAGNGTLGAKGDTHVLSSYRIDVKTGALRQLGAAIALPERPINLGLDHQNRFVVVAYNQSATLSVHTLKEDGSVSSAVAQNQVPEAGIFTHQVTFTPGDKSVVALARGNDAVANVPDQPGSINTFTIDDQGHLSKLVTSSIDPGVGPRHLAYHPTQPWVYVSMERGSKLYMYPLESNGTLATKPLFRKDTLQYKANLDTPRQRGGVIQVNPNGKYLYVTNRADATVEQDGKQVSAGGENNVAVFKIDGQTGEPQLIQIIDAQGIEGRTMKVDPSGKLLVVANQKTLWVKDGDSLKKIRSNLAIFRIKQDGKLEFVRKYEMDDEKKALLWMDI